MTRTEEFIEKARRLNDEGKYNDVVTLLTDDLLEADHDPNSYVEKGKAYWRLGRYDLMNLAADKALEIQPEHVGGLELKGKYFEELQNFDKAFEYYDQALKLENPDKSLTPLKEVIEKARRLNDEGRYAEVTSYLADDLLKTYHHADLYSELALAHWRLGQYDLVAQAADKALQIRPNHAFALNLKGKYFEAVKDYDKSLEYYDRAIRLEHLGEQLMPLKEVIDKARQLNNEGKYEEAISFLTDDLLATYHHADLYFRRGFAHWKLAQYEQVGIAAEKAVLLQPNHVKALDLKGKYFEAIGDYSKSLQNYDDALKLEHPSKNLTPLKVIIDKAKRLNDQGKNSEVISLLTDDILRTYHHADLYSELALAHWRMGQFSLVKGATDKALDLNPRHVDALNLRGNYLLTNKEYDKALEAYNAALQIDPGYYILYYNLGIVYAELKKTDEAIANYKKAISLNEKHADSHYNLGLVYEGLKRYDDAIEAYEQARTYAPKFAFAYYGLGLAYTGVEKYRQAIKSFEDFLQLTEDKTSLYYSFAKSEIERLKKLLESPDYLNIGTLVHNIKNLLEFKEGRVTHYTSLSTAKALILEESKLRLSEGTFLNDTSEGRELARFLGISPVTKPAEPAKEKEKEKNKEDDIFSTRFIKKPFIGSFVAANKQNNLTLWRMYGKEEKDEAKGCAITLEAMAMLANLKEDLLSRAKVNTSRSAVSETESSRGGATLSEAPSSMAKTESEEFKFFRVAYLKDEDKRFIVPGFSEEDEEQLNEYMDRLRKAVNLQGKNEKETHDLIELLNEVAYLFKSAEYQYEHEVRLIIKDMDIFEKVTNKPPRVYIELVTIKPLIRTITLGPKVERADEWASSFFYSFNKQKLPEIRISHLPFK